jgi:hypothetical protein
MPDAIDEDHFAVIVDFEENPIFPAADAIGVLGGKFLNPERARFIRQEDDAGGDPLNLFLWKRIEIALGCGFKNDFECHAF